MAAKTGYEIAIERIEEVAKTGASHLDLSGLGLSKIPEELIYDPKILRGVSQKENIVELVDPSRLLSVCLIHIPNDAPRLSKIINILRKKTWIDLWLEEEKLIPGQDWAKIISNAASLSDVVILCLSEEMNRTEGGIQQINNKIYDAFKLMPDRSGYVIPLRLDTCETYDWLYKIQHDDYFPEARHDLVHERLLESLKLRAQKLSIIHQQPDSSLKKLPVFLCYTKEDRLAAFNLYHQLNSEGWMDVWIGEINLLPGMHWEAEIEEAITGAEIAIVCLSSYSIEKVSYYSQELRLIIEKSLELPGDNRIFLIPIRLDDCKIPRGINRQHLDYFPKKSLSLGYNKLLRSIEIRAQDAIPARFQKRNLNLNSIDLSSNSFKELPFDDSQFRNLSKLSLAHNQISSFSENDIKQITRIEELNLAGNEIEDLPKEIKLLKNLSVLDLSNNAIKQIPPETGDLLNLSHLNLSHNQLINLPPEIGRLKQLSYFNISNNQFSNPPLAIKNFSTLKMLDIRDNPLSVPPEILEKFEEPKQILNYLTEIWAGRRRQLSETKMLVVGQGSVGKTSLIKRLTRDFFSSHETKTDGIAIDRWQVPNLEKGEDQPEFLRVNIWDFGGQEIMHATHQFFLTRRSLYMLVLDSRISQEENRVEYWLKIIQSFGGDSPVLIVGNKLDQHPLDIDQTGLQKKYPNIVGIVETSAASGAGLNELREIIAAQVNKLPHIRDSLPETWFNVKNQLELLGHVQNYISEEKYTETCLDGEIKDETSQKTLIGFLHDLGVVLHFQDDPHLESLGILNPQWVTNGVYKILNERNILESNGVMTLSMLNNILSSPQYPSDKRLFIVEMMKKFELCYDIDQDRFLIPDLLPKSEPFVGEKEWEDALAFQYHYNVLPTSIITRYIVRMNMNGFIHKTVWRSGVVLQKNGNTALVKADTEDKKIYIWVNGTENTRRDFLSVIRAEFDAIHKTIIKIEAIQKVPHPDYLELILDYEELLQFERKQIPEFQRSVKDDIITVNVRQLLNGVRIGSESVPVVERTASPTPVAVKSSASVTVPTPQPSLSLKVVHLVFIELPKAIGRIPLDLVGKGKDAADTTTVSLGYGIIILVVLIWLGYLGFDPLLTLLKDTWRFFFPVKP